MSTEHVRNARVSVDVPICVFGRNRDQFYYGLLVPGEVVDYLRAIWWGNQNQTYRHEVAVIAHEITHIQNGATRLMAVTKGLRRPESSHQTAR